MEINYIDNENQLAAVRKRLSQVEIIGLDTEFHAENRYFPELMLMQIATTKDQVWLIDPLAVQIGSLGEQLRNLKLITHGGQEDIRLFQRFFGFAPQYLFDTQIAAAFLGSHYPMRMSSLTDKILAQAPSKPTTETLTNWSKRPLSDEQKQYAAQDATILLELYQSLEQQLSPQLKQWVWMASKEMGDRSLQPIPVEETWQKWGVANQLDVTSQRILNHLLHWREKTGKAKNKPANYILPRSIALDIARRRPKKIKELTSNRRINQGLVHRHGTELLDCVYKGLRDKTIFHVPPAEKKHHRELIRAWAMCLPFQIHLDVLMPSDLATQIATRGIGALTGWRKEAYGESLQAFLNGEIGMFLQKGTPKLTKLT